MIGSFLVFSGAFFYIGDRVFFGLGWAFCSGVGHNIGVSY